MTDYPTPLDTRAAARYLGISKSSLEKTRVFGGGPKYLKLQHLVRYRIQDLDAWMSERLFSSTSEQREGFKK